MSRDRRLAADRPVRVVGIPPQTLSAFPPPGLSAYTGALAQSHCEGRVDGVDNNQPHFFISRTKRRRCLRYLESDIRLHDEDIEQVT